MKKIRIGSGAGYAGDRIEPAVELMEKGNLDYIIFDRAAGQRERSVEGLQPAARLPNGKNSPADGEKQSKSYYQYGSCQPGICCRTDV
mgnify:CR=1 FL=1